MPCSDGSTYTVKCAIHDDPGNSALQELKVYTKPSGGSFTLRLTTTTVDDLWSGGCVGLFRATNSTYTSTLEWDNFKCGLDRSSLINDTVDDVGTDYVYADYNFDDSGGSSWQKITLSHDDNGNLIDDGLFKYTYDAWNRLVGAWYSAGDKSDNNQRVSRYEYDGLFRRVEKEVTNRGTGIVYISSLWGVAGVQAGNLFEHYYYAGWRLIETRNGSDQTLGQSVWGTQYIDEAVCYDRNSDPGSNNDCLDTGFSSGDGSQRYFYSQDANFRVVALIGEGGAVVERYEYSAYGEPQILNNQNQSGSNPGNATMVSVVGNPFMHQGLFRDGEIRVCQNRYREHISNQGRFMQRDVAYFDGLNLYHYLLSGTLSLVDPFGRQTSQSTSRPTTQEGGVSLPDDVIKTINTAWKKTEETSHEHSGVITKDKSGKTGATPPKEGTGKHAWDDSKKTNGVGNDKTVIGGYHTHPNTADKVPVPFPSAEDLETLSGKDAGYLVIVSANGYTSITRLDDPTKLKGCFKKYGGESGLRHKLEDEIKDCMKCTFGGVQECGAKVLNKYGGECGFSVFGRFDDPEVNDPFPPVGQ